MFIMRGICFLVALGVMGCSGATYIDAPRPDGGGAMAVVAEDLGDAGEPMATPDAGSTEPDAAPADAHDAAPTEEAAAPPPPPNDAGPTCSSDQTWCCSATACACIDTGACAAWAANSEDAGADAGHVTPVPDAAPPPPDAGHPPAPTYPVKCDTASGTYACDGTSTGGFGYALVWYVGTSPKVCGSANAPACASGARCVVSNSSASLEGTCE